MNWVIYVLKHPRTQEARYVGWTSRRPEKRLQCHITETVTSQSAEKSFLCDTNDSLFHDHSS
jgi:hypothetical protein